MRETVRRFPSGAPAAEVGVLADSSRCVTVSMRVSTSPSMLRPAERRRRGNITAHSHGHTETRDTHARTDAHTHAHTHTHAAPQLSAMVPPTPVVSSPKKENCVHCGPGVAAA